MGPAGNEREIAMARRDKTIPEKPPRARAAPLARARKGQAPVTVAASSSSQPPPPPGAGGVKAEHFSIAKKPRAATATRPLVAVPSVAGVKRKATEQGGTRRPPQPKPVVQSNRKRAAPPPEDDKPAKKVKVTTPPMRKKSSIWKQAKALWVKAR